MGDLHWRSEGHMGCTWGSGGLHVGCTWVARGQEYSGDGAGFRASYY